MNPTTMQTTSFKSSTATTTSATATATATAITKTVLAATRTSSNSQQRKLKHKQNFNNSSSIEDICNSEIASGDAPERHKRRNYCHTRNSYTATPTPAPAITPTSTPATTTALNFNHNLSSNKIHQKPKAQIYHYNNNNTSNSNNCSSSSSITRATTLRIGILCILLQLNAYFHHITATSLMHMNDYLNTERPYFDDVSARNVSAITDDRAILKCRVKNKGNRTVSWMRKRDLHILTTNIYTYTGDQRFSVLHTPGSDDWDLKIDYAQQRDSGIYECQVNTEPKINLAIALEVHAATDVKLKSADTAYYDAKAARAKILGSTEIHVKRDSTIALACSVNIHASSVAWYHGAAIVDFDSLRGGISLETEKTEIGTTSRLMLTRASFRDSGNYTCVPNGAIPASVRVHVLTGEQPAAMQTSNAIMPTRIGVKRPNQILTTTHFTIGLLCVSTLLLWQFIIISQATTIYAAYCVGYNQRKRQLQQQKRQLENSQIFMTNKLKKINYVTIQQKPQQSQQPQEQQQYVLQHATHLHINVMR